MVKRLCVLLLFAAAGGAATAQSYTSIFRPAVQLTSTLVNTVYSDYAPTVTGDGLTLYWTSNRPAPTSLSTLAGRNVWSVSRADLTSPWSNLTFETGLNTALNEDYMCVQADDLEMFVSTNRTGGQGLGDIWQFSRASTAAPWGNPTNLGINLATFEDDPSVTADGLELYWVATDTTTPSAAGIFWATRPAKGSTMWVAQGMVPQTVSTSQDHSASISPDGLTLIWSSTRPGGLGSSDLWMITRPDRATTIWSTPVNVQELNSTAWDHNGQFGPDGFTYWYTQAARNLIFEARRIRPLTLVEDAKGTPAPVQVGITGVKLGSSMRVSCRHDPGATAQLYLTLAALPSPLSIPNVSGALEVNLGSLIFPVAATTGAISVKDGRYRLFPIGIPNAGPLAGFTFYIQSGVQSGSLIAISSLTTVQLTP